MRETRGLVESTRWQVVRAPASPLAPRRCRHAQMTRARRSIKRGASSPSRRNSLSSRHHIPRPQPDPLSQCYTNILYDVLFGFCSNSSQSRPFFVLTFLTLCASCGISFNQMVVYRPGTKFIPSLQTGFLQQLFPPSSSHIFSCLAKASLCLFVASCRTSDVFEKVKRSLTILWIWLVLSVGVCFLCTCVYWPIQIPLRPVGVTCRHGFFPVGVVVAVSFALCFSSSLSLHQSIQVGLQLLKAKNQALSALVAFIIKRLDTTLDFSWNEDM